MTSDKTSEWLASCGFLFPRNKAELDRSELLDGAVDPSIKGNEIDPFKIIQNSNASKLNFTSEEIKYKNTFDITRVIISRKILDKLRDSNKKEMSKNTFVKKWNHKSVVGLIEESGNANAYDEIKIRARKKVLYALDNGWEGPPFSAIKLAQILQIEVSANDEVSDARTISLGKNKFKIEYNPFQKPTRLNFSISHEIVHTFFPDCYEAIRNREENPDENRELEELCNIGASELQLPYIVFPGDANALSEITLINLIDLATKYKTSLEALFLAFIQIIDRSCAIIICTFKTEKELIISYYKGSSTFKPIIPKNFKIPEGSVAYLCNTPGYTKQETVRWDFLDNKYDIHCIGLSPVRKDNRGRVGIIVVPNDGREDIQDRKISIDYGDATKPEGKGVKIIAQVVNTGGSLARGFGKSLQKNFPIVKKEMDKWKSTGINFRLGQSQLIKVTEDTYVFQMLAQKGIFPKDGKIPLDYDALELCLIELRETAQELNAQVHMPLIGSGNARGKWEFIEGLIYTHLVNQNVTVHIYLWGKKKPADFNPTASLSLFNEKSTWEKEN